VKIPTETQAAAGQTANHSFKPDEKVCASCHADKVDGVGLKGAISMQMADLAAATGTTIQTQIAAAIAANGKLTVRAVNEQEVFSSATSTTYNIDVTQAPAKVEVATLGGQLTFWLTVTTPISITWTDGKTESVTKFGVQLGGLQTPVSGKATPVIAAGSTTFKACWNYLLLSGDGSGGIHNPTFFMNTIAATKSALASVK